MHRFYIQNTEFNAKISRSDDIDTDVEYTLKLHKSDLLGTPGSARGSDLGSGGGREIRCGCKEDVAELWSIRFMIAQRATWGNADAFQGDSENQLSRKWVRGARKPPIIYP